MTVELKPGERLDDLQTAGLRLIQRPGTFRFGTDSVLLADFASPKRGERIVDLGCGNGAIALLLAGHRPDAAIEAVELQAELADMAERSVRLNGLEDRVRVYCMDMRVAWREIGRERCSLVVCNPPYGERLEDKKNLPVLYGMLGERYRMLDSWSMYLITAYGQAEQAIGRKADKNRKIYNGMLKTYFYQFQGPKPGRNGHAAK